MPQQTQANELRYSNYLEVGQNAFEFVLHFGQRYEDDGKETVIHTRIVTSPAYAKRFAKLLAEAVGSHEHAHGAIPDAEA